MRHLLPAEGIAKTNGTILVRAEPVESGANEKQCTLIRYDVLIVLRKVFDKSADAALPAKARELIATEPDAKYIKKYSGVWPAKP